jgi:hypothetical protein
VARCSKQPKDRVLARVLPPESATPEIVAGDAAVTVQTLERWRSDDLLEPVSERIWTAGRGPARHGDRHGGYGRRCSGVLVPAALVAGRMTGD